MWNFPLYVVLVHTCICWILLCCHVRGFSHFFGRFPAVWFQGLQTEDVICWKGWKVPFVQSIRTHLWFVHMDCTVQIKLDWICQKFICPVGLLCPVGNPALDRWREIALHIVSSQIPELLTRSDTLRHSVSSISVQSSWTFLMEETQTGSFTQSFTWPDTTSGG